MKKQWQYGIVLFVVILLVLSTSLVKQPAQAASTMVEVGEVRTIEKKVKIPVNLRDVSYLTSLIVEIEPSITDGSVRIEGFEPTKMFDGQQFRTTSDVRDNKLRIDTISTTGSHVKLSDVTTIGYIHIQLKEQFTAGSTADILITSISGKGSSNKPITIGKMNGQVEFNIPYGDVLGENRPSAAGAMRILQHVSGESLITDPDALLAADVDGDGTLTQTDAMHILEYVAGKRSNFLTIGMQGLDSAVLNSEYTTKFEGMHGRADYEFQRISGTLPYGLKLNKTGELSGKPTKAGKYTFTIQVTDALGEKASRQFTIEVIDSNIKSVDKLVPVYVKQGEVPTLPSTVTVTYMDNTKGIESVDWEEIDTSKVGMTILKGKVGNTGFTTSVEVHVVSAKHLLDVEINYYDFMKFYSVAVDVTSNVHKVEVNDLVANYEGNNRFSISSTTFGQNSFVVIRLYDRYGNLLETKQQPLR